MGAWTRAVASVDLGAVTANVAELIRRNSGAELMAMVKADGYGHGAVEVSRAAQAGGAGWLGVAFADEALALRAAGIAGPMLILVVNPGEDLAPVVAREVDVSVSAPWALQQVARAARAAGVPAGVHLEVDTGMTRGGARPDTWPALLAATRAAVDAGTITLAGIWSHLVHDDPRHPFTAGQSAALAAAIETAITAGLRPAYSHLSKSTTALSRPELGLDLVRAGLAVYGLTPHGPPDPGLRPAMTFQARVALTGRVAGGTGVGYGHRHVSAADTGVALVPVGYADGVPRAGSQTIEVMIGGRRRRIAGTVSMDQFTVEVGEDAVGEGDEVLLFGPGDAGEATAGEWAEATGTVSYEIVTRVGSRVPRRYTGGAG